jgi:hypothetical protein
MVTYRRRRRRAGRGLMDALRSAHNWIKRNKIISTVGSALGKVGVPYAGAIGTVAGSLGYGRRRRGRPRVHRVRRMIVVRQPLVRVRRVRRKRGNGLRDILAKAHGFIKANKLVSKGLSHFGHSKLASAASALGYGRRRVRRSRRVGGASVNQLARIKF